MSYLCDEYSHQKINYRLLQHANSDRLEEMFVKTSVRVAGYLLYTALLIFGLWLLFYYDAVLLEHRNTTYQYWPYLWFNTLYPILIFFCYRSEPALGLRDRL